MPVSMSPLSPAEEKDPSWEGRKRLHCQHLCRKGNSVPPCSSTALKPHKSPIYLPWKAPASTWLLVQGHL